MGSTGILPRICDRLVPVSVGEWHLSIIAAYKKPSRIWSNIFRYKHHTHTFAMANEMDLGIFAH
jgi:hypothetical protein